MITFKTITGKEISVSSNKRDRTFTIKTDAAKYRTTKMSEDEYQSALNYTGNDWQNFLRTTNDYYKI